MNISSGKIKSAQKLVLYAPEGFGKSTFASKFPSPLFIDTEGSTKQLDVKRFEDDMSKWENIIDAAKYVAGGSTDCKTLVIDTIDWAEQACIDKLNKDHGTSNILTMDYGKGSLFVVGEFKTLMDKLDEIVSHGINVVLLAHATMRKQELPEEMGAFDHWELKLQSKQVKSMVKEWADIVLFGNYKTYVVIDEKTKSKKAQGGKRVLYTEHHACWDAKNRHGLAPEIPFEYKYVADIFGEEVKAEKSENPAVKAEKKPEKKSGKTEAKTEAAEELTKWPPETNAIAKKLQELMDASHFTEEEIIETFHEKGKFTDVMALAEITDWDFIEKSVVGNWEKFKRAVEKYGLENPFIPHWEEKNNG